MLKTVVYIGDRPNYGFEIYKFPKGVPITIPEFVYKRLPMSMFEEFDKHTVQDNIQPISMNVPRALDLLLYAIPAIEKIRWMYPHTPIEIVCLPEYRPLLEHIENVTFPKAVKADPLGYYKQMKFKISDGNVYFSGGATIVHTMESCFKVMLDIWFHDVRDIPTMHPLSHKVVPEKLTFLNFGLTAGTTFDKISTEIETRSISNDAEIINIDPGFSEMLDILMKTKYLVSISDHPYCILAAYLGIPQFVFIKNHKSSIVSHQLNHFNNARPDNAIRASFSDKEPHVILNEILKVYEMVMAGKPVMPRQEKTDANTGDGSKSKPKTKSKSRSKVPKTKSG